MNAEWPVVALGDIVDRRTAKNTVDETNVLTISARHGLVSQRHFFNKQVASKDLGHYFLLERGHFAYNKSYSDGYPVGAIKRLEKYERGVVSPLYICFHVKDERRVSSDFLAQYFEGGLLEPGLRSIAKEGARNHGLLNVKPAEFFGLSVHIPPLNEQKKIAAILSSMDDAIAGTQRVLDQLHVLKRAMMAELITQGMPGTHTRFKATEVGKVPEDWQVTRLETLCSRIVDGVHKKPDYVPAGVPFVTVKNLTAVDEGISFADLNYVTEADHRMFIKRAHPEQGDILLTKDGTLGIPRLIDTDRTFSIFVSVALLKPKRDLIDPWFMRFALEAPPIAAHFGIVNAGQALKHIHLVDLRATPFALPPIDEQVAISTVLRSVCTRISVERDSLKAIRELKAALVSVLLTGEIPVKPDLEST